MGGWRNEQWQRYMLSVYGSLRGEWRGGGEEKSGGGGREMIRDTIQKGGDHVGGGWRGERKVLCRRYCILEKPICVASRSGGDNVSPFPPLPDFYCTPTVSRPPPQSPEWTAEQKRRGKQGDRSDLLSSRFLWHDYSLKRENMPDFGMQE